MDGEEHITVISKPIIRDLRDSNRVTSCVFGKLRRECNLLVSVRNPKQWVIGDFGRLRSCL